MISLDTNVILRFILDDIPEQTKRATAVIAQSPCYVTDVVVTETVFVLERVIGLPRQDIAALMRAFLTLRTVSYNDYLLPQVIDHYINKPSLSFVDCYALAEAGLYRATLVSFDKQLVKRGGGKVREP